MTHDNTTNRGPLLAEIELIERHGDLKTSALALAAELAKLPQTLELDDADALEDVAGYVRRARDMDSQLEAKRTEEKTPFDNAGKVVQGFFKPAQDKLADAKKNAERIIGDRNARLKRREQERAEEAAKLARAEAEKTASAAAALEDKGAGSADLVMDYAVGQEAQAVALEAQAQGPTADLVRTRTGSGLVSSRLGPWQIEFVDREAFKATLGPLRDSFTQEAVEKACRTYAVSETAAGREPVLPGVRLWREELANVR